MARRLSWSDVRGGAVAAIALGLIVVATLKFSNLANLHGDTIPIYAHVGEARGITVGSEVWLSGQKIGKIVSIRFRDPSADTGARIEIGMRVLDRYRAAIHRDAVAPNPEWRHVARSAGHVHESRDGGDRRAACR